MAIKEIAAKSGGIVFIATIKNTVTSAVLDISSATKMEFRFKSRQLKSVGKKATAAFYSDGKDGKMKFTTTTAHFDLVGDWDIQGYLVMTGYSGYTKQAAIKVLDIIEV